MQTLQKTAEIPQVLFWVDVLVKCSDKFQQFPATAEVPQFSSSAEFNEDFEADLKGFFAAFATLPVGVVSQFSADF